MEPLQEPAHPHMETFERLSAFYLFTRHGLDIACSVYPKQKDFIIENMGKTLDEVRQEAYRRLDKNNPPVLP